MCELLMWCCRRGLAAASGGREGCWALGSWGHQTRVLIYSFDVGCQCDSLTASCFAFQDSGAVGDGAYVTECQQCEDLTGMVVRIDHFVCVCALVPGCPHCRCSALYSKVQPGTAPTHSPTPYHFLS